MIDKYYMPFIEIKDFNALTNNKPFCEQPIKKQKAHEKLVEMLRSDDYTRENLLYFLYHQKYYKRIVRILYKRIFLKNLN